MMFPQISNAKVGVAPATTTLRLDAPVYNPYATLPDMRGLAGPLGVINPGDWWLTGRSYGLPGTIVLNLDRRKAGLDGALGLFTREAVRTVGVHGAGLGNVPMPWTNVPNAPNDFQLAPIRGYLPHRMGWIVGQPAPRRDGFGGLGQEPSDSAVRELARVQKTQLWLSAFTTLALVAVAGVTIYNAVAGGACKVPRRVR